MLDLMRANATAPMFAAKIAVVAEHLIARGETVALEPSVELNTGNLQGLSVLIAAACNVVNGEETHVLFTAAGTYCPSIDSKHFGLHCDGSFLHPSKVFLAMLLIPSFAIRSVSLSIRLVVATALCLHSFLVRFIVGRIGKPTAFSMADTAPRSISVLVARAWVELREWFSLFAAGTYFHSVSIPQ